MPISLLPEPALPPPPVPTLPPSPVPTLLNFVPPLSPSWVIPQFPSIQGPELPPPILSRVLGYPPFPSLPRSWVAPSTQDPGSPLPTSFWVIPSLISSKVLGYPSFMLSKDNQELLPCLGLTETWISTNLTILS